MTTPDHSFPVRTGTPFAEIDLTTLMRSLGHSGWLGMRFHAQSDGWIELAMPWNAEIMGDEADATLAAGPIISLLDNATGIAAWQRRGFFAPQVTVDLRFDHLRAPAPGRTVIGRGECYAIAHSVAYIRGVAYDGAIDDPIVHVAGSFMLLDGGAA